MAKSELELLESLSPGTPLKQAMKVARKLGINVRQRKGTDDILFSIPGQPIEAVSMTKGDLGKTTLCRIKKWFDILNLQTEETEMETLKTHPPLAKAGSVTDLLLSEIYKTPGLSSYELHIRVSKSGKTLATISGLLSSAYKRGIIDRAKIEGVYQYYPMGQKPAQPKSEMGMTEPAQQLKQPQTEWNDFHAMFLEMRSATETMRKVGEQMETLTIRAQHIISKHDEVLKADTDLTDALHLLADAMQQFIKIRTNTEC